MERREFLVRFGEVMVSVPTVLLAVRCGDDNGGTTAPPGTDGFTETSTTVSGHNHTVFVLNSDMSNPPQNGVTYTSSTSGGHTHRITLTQQQCMSINGGGSVTVTSTVESGHSHDWTIQR